MGNEIYRIDIPIEVKDSSGPTLKSAQSNVEGVDRAAEKATRALKRLSTQKVKLDADDQASPKMDRVREKAVRATRTKPITFSLVAVDQATTKMDQVEQRARRMSRAKPVTFPLTMVGAGAGGESLQELAYKADQARQSVLRLGQTHGRAIISTDDRATRVIRGVIDAGSHIAGRTWTVTMKALDMVTSPVRGLFRLLTSMPGMLGLGAGGFGGVVAPLMMADQLTQANTGFTTFLGSAEKAKAFMADLQKMGADTPFETDWLTGQATTLLPALNKDPKMVQRALKAFGDAGALTGAGTNGIELALMGFRQIGSVGTLSMEELKQVTENLRVPLSLITDELGVAQGDVAKIGSKGIPAAKAMEAILKALERPVSKGGFLGGMSVMMETLSGQLSMLKDNVKINLLQRWGQGLESGTIPLFKNLNALFTDGADTVKDWGDALERAGRSASTWVTDKVRAASQAVKSLTASAAWQHADGFWAKAKVAWDQLIQQPFDEWWGGGGEKWIADKAAMMGHGFGSALGGFLASALGIAAGDANDNSFMKAGKTAGSAFLEAFLEAFDTQKLVDKAAKAGWGILKETGKLTPGGEKPSAVSWLSLLPLAWGAKKGFDIWAWVRTMRGAGGPAGAGGGSVQTVEQAVQAVKAGAQAETPAVQALTQGSRQLSIFDKGTMQPAFDLSSVPKIGTGAAQATESGYATAGPLTTAAGAAAVAGGITVGWMLSQDIGGALTKYLDKEEAARQKTLADTARRLNPTKSEMSTMANTPATIGAAKPDLSFWEELFLSPWAKSQREAKWEKEQAALREAAMAKWQPPGGGVMTDTQEQEFLRKAFRAANAVTRTPVPVEAPTPPANQVQVQVTSSPSYTITAKADAQEILDLIRQHSASLADQLQGAMAQALEAAQRNTVAVRGRAAIAID